MASNTATSVNPLSKSLPSKILITTHILPCCIILLDPSIKVSKSSSSLPSAPTPTPLTAITGLDASPTGNPSLDTTMAGSPNDTTFSDPFGGDKLDKIAGSDDMQMPPRESPDNLDSPMHGDGGSPTRDRRQSKEWDASKVPPSQFQRRKGSIYSTPSSRDAHLDRSEVRDKAYWDKLKEKGWVPKKA
ncbi:hypothetical protein IWZ00DRAFT_572704 [Phyllosticta capitalensis]